MGSNLNFLYNRPVGIEIEVNSLDGNNVTPKDQLPTGIHFVANLIVNTLNEYVEVRGFGHTHWYKTYGHWVLKPDNSCGIEVCSPIVHGWIGLKKVCQVVDVFQNNPLINVNSDCALHVHVDISDLKPKQIANILKWWIKCEPIFFDSVPDSRKNNRYCQFIGLRDLNILDDNISDDIFIEWLGISKYGSINSFHFWHGERNTLEFRLGENTLCKNSFFLKNWVRLIVHFLETAKNTTPESLVWLDVKDVFEFLGFFRNDLSTGMIQVRNWFLGRIYYNMGSNLDGFFSDGRIVTKSQVNEILRLFTDFNLRQSLYPNECKYAVYDKIYST